MTAAILLMALAASGAVHLQSVLDDSRESQDLPGISAVVVRNDKILFSGASGFADLKTATPMSADSVLYIGSLSKVLTAVLVLQLVEAGRLSLDDNIADFGIERAGDDLPITVAQLLSHSSGLQREGNSGYWFTADFPDDNALRRYLKSTRLRTPPGTSLHYSNIGFAVLGQLVERVTGQSYPQALSDRVLTPLGMDASAGRGPAPKPAMGYTPIAHVLPGQDRPFAGLGEPVGGRHERAYHDARAMSPAFGVYSSANDMGRLVSFLLGFGGDEVLEAAVRARLYEAQPSGRGLGLRLARLGGRTVARHDGWFAAHRTHLLLDIENGFGAIVMANSDDAEPGEIAEALLQAASRVD